MNVIITGAENTGSRLVAKIVAHVHGVAKFGEWHGFQSISKNGVRILHRSIPYTNIYPDFSNSYKNSKFIIYTRYYGVTQKKHQGRDETRTKQIIKDNKRYYEKQ